MSNFEKELRALINVHSRENHSNTPDFVLAKYLVGCLDLFDETINQRDDWMRSGIAGNQETTNMTQISATGKDRRIHK